jgi:triacylglycerol lipase
VEKRGVEAEVYCSGQGFSNTSRWAFSMALLMVLLLTSSGCGNRHVAITSPLPKESLNQCVILLHGLGRSYRAMEGMQQLLTEHGYYTVNLGYPSTNETVESIIDNRLSLAYQECQEFSPDTIHFVAHSLGGIILRKAFSDSKPVHLGRVVMLSPPNKGSPIVDTMKDWALFKWLTGPAGQQLSTAPDSLPNSIGPVDYPVGVITGNSHTFFDSWFAAIIPGEDDGKVSVESARVEGMIDFLVVSESHPYIMQSRYVQLETLHFLKYGRFKHQKDSLHEFTGEDE